MANIFEKKRTDLISPPEQLVDEESGLDVIFSHVNDSNM